MVSAWVLIGLRHQEWSQKGSIISNATGPPEKVQFGFKISVLALAIRIDQKWISKSKLKFQIFNSRSRQIKVDVFNLIVDVVKVNVDVFQ